MREHLFGIVLVLVVMAGCGPSPEPHNPADFAVPASGSSLQLTLEAQSTARSCEDPQRLDRALGAVHWGEDAESVLNTYKQELDARYAKEAAELIDPGKQDQLRANYEARVAKARSTLTALDEISAGKLIASIVGPEFVAGGDESLFWIRDEVATRYYFFADDALYKLVVAYLPESLDQVSFDQFVAAVSGRYGVPTNLVSDNEDFVVRAQWQDKCGNSLRADEKVKTFGTFVLAFAEASTEEQRASAHQTAYEASLAGRDMSHLNELTESGVEEPTHRTADDLVGETHVNLDAGQDESAEEGLTPEERAKTLAAKKAKRAKRSKLKKKDFQDLAPAKVDTEHFFIP